MTLVFIALSAVSIGLATSTTNIEIQECARAVVISASPVTTKNVRALARSLPKSFALSHKHLKTLLHQKSRLKSLYFASPPSLTITYSYAIFRLRHFCAACQCSSTTRLRPPPVGRCLERRLFQLPVSEGWRPGFYRHLRS